MRGQGGVGDGGDVVAGALPSAAMRWERLFADLEAQWERESRRDLDAEVAERTRRERATVELFTRLAGHRGQPILAELVTGEKLEGQLDDIGTDWLLLRVPGGGELLVTSGSLIGLVGLGTRVDPGASARRFGLGYALRVLARDRAPVVLTDRSGRRRTGTIDVVGADALDLAEHPPGEPRRAGNVRGQRTVPFAAIVSIASR